MDKQSNKNQTVEPVAAPRLPPLNKASTWAVTTLIIAAVAGIFLSAFSTWTHYQLTQADGVFTAFCNLSENINCEDVVTSRFGKLLNVPVSIWGLAFYCLLVSVAWRVRSPDPARSDAARADALALVLGGALFSTYLASISIFILKALCPICVTLYVVAFVTLISGLFLASPFAAIAAHWKRRGAVLSEHPILTLVGVVAIGGMLVAPSFFETSELLSKAEIRKADPEFYRWYANRPIVEIPEGTGHARGPTDAPLTIVEFADFQCPNCQQAHFVMKDILPRFQGRIRFIFHHYPLSNICNPSVPGPGHRHSCGAAEAAECAGEQGKFESFVNLLFERQKYLGGPEIDNIAKELALDMDRFNQCRQGDAVTNRITADIAAAEKAGVRFTPTFFVNGRKVQGDIGKERWLYAFGIELESKSPNP